MPYQIFVDESEGAPPGVRSHFVMAGLIGHSEDWAKFSDEWRICLAAGPRHLDYFKMKEAAGRNGQFFGWSKKERNEKLRALCQIINRYAKICTWSVIDLQGHAETWGKLPKPRSEPYFWPFQNTIMAACFALWDAGLRQQFEAIFDEQVIFGPRAREWYPLVVAAGKHREPEASKILPLNPVFRNDKKFLPLQAADLYAWTIRKATNDPDYTEYHWLLAELQNVQATDYSQYYDHDRMQNVLNMSVRMAQDGEVPDHLVKDFGYFFKSRES